MTFKWLKSMLPKGLYGRAALILVVPVVAIQLSVSVVFIQRFFEDITRQMTSNVAREVALLRDHVNGLEDTVSLDQAMRDVADPLRLSIRQLPLEQVQTGDRRPLSDLTGFIVTDVLREILPELLLVDLSSERGRVILDIETNKGPMRVQFARNRVSASNPHQLLVLMIVVSLFMTLISFIFLRNQVRPIRRLARAAEAFGKGRHVPYHVSGATEVRQAGQAFIDMRNRINRQIEQRTLMLSGVSHDLRTPLTRLKLGLSLAVESDETRALMRDVDDMEEMLQEFLAFARGDSLEESQKIDPVALATLLVEDANRSGGDVSLNSSNIPTPAVLISVRPISLRRALDNLVMNALRYGSKCEVRLDIDATDITFTIEDDGPGIPADQREKALRPFERLDAARNQNKGSGVGLGLAIAMDVTSSHGGTLSLSQSENLGGLKVVLGLPR